MLQITGLLDRPSGGTIELGGEDCTQLSDVQQTRMRRDNLGFVYQFHHFAGIRAGKCRTAAAVNGKRDC